MPFVRSGIVNTTCWAGMEGAMWERSRGLYNEKGWKKFEVEEKSQIDDFLFSLFTFFKRPLFDNHVGIFSGFSGLFMS